MVMPKQDEKENLVYGLKLSSVVPGRVSGENRSHELRPIDLAMKLHYLKALYFFPNTANDSNNTLISIGQLKKPMFEWLVSYFKTCGRIRLSPDPDTRPIIKLNDAGIRIAEARSSKTIHEWLAMDGFFSLQDQLVYGHALGPDLSFSPLVFIQITWFKCGGISVGLSWAHILGDVFSASTFMNMFGQHLQGQEAQILAYPGHSEPEYGLPSPPQEPLPVKRVDPVGDHWVAATNCKMSTHFFSLTSAQLGKLVSKLHGPKETEQRMGKWFEMVSAIMWKTIAKVRKDSEPKVVTICRPKSLGRDLMMPHNGQVISTAKFSLSASETDILELESLITESRRDESGIIEEAVKEDKGKFDYVVYGANLTFVDMEGADIYGFRVEGQRSVFASYTIGGVGEAGAVLVLQGVKSGTTIVVTLPEYELQGVKNELKKEWCIV